MRTPLLTASLSLAATFASANPGALLFNGGSIDRPGDVLSSSVGDDGAVTLAGLFYRMGEVRVPGVTRLLPDGSPDGEFSSSIGISPQEPSPLTGQPSVTVVPCPVLVPWDSGTMLADPPILTNLEETGTLENVQATGRRLWVVLGENGMLQLNLTLAVTPQEPVLPQFVQDGKLVAIVSSQDAATRQFVPRVRRLRMDTGRDDDGFTPGISGIPIQAAMADGGGLWVMTNEAGSPRLSRLAASGAPLEGTTARALFGESRLLPLAAGRVAVKSERFEFEPVTGGTWSSQVQFLNADGSAGAVRAFTQGVLPFSAGPDGSVLVYQADNNLGANWRNLWRELPDGTRDEAFQSIRTRRSLLHLKDGRMLADGTKRYLSDGSKDPAWSAPEPMDHGIVKQLFAGPGGTVYGTGDFTEINGARRPGITRWMADGTLDASFAPVAEEGEVLDCAPLTDGYVAVLRRAGNVTTITRLRPDGAMDRVLARRDADQIVQIEPWTQGSVLAQSSSATLRISQTGGETLVTTLFNGALGLHALPDGRFFANGRLWLEQGGIDWSFAPGAGTASVPLSAVAGGRWLFLRNGLPAVLNADGSVAFTIPAAGLKDAPSSAAAGPARTFYFAQHGQITRHYADGRRDPTFCPARMERRNESVPADMPLLSALQNGGPANAHAMLLHPVTGSLWVAGDFTRVNGVLSPGLAVLSAELPGSFAAWSAAIFPNPSQRPAEADPDADGVSNWQEYAAGSDPLQHDAGQNATVILATEPLCISAPLNPNAPEVVQVPEVSTDLRTWRTAGGAEVVSKTLNGSPAFELAPAVGPRFVRIRYRSIP
jgi:hypothetical protein